MSLTPEQVLEETLVKLSFRRFHGGYKGSGTPETRVDMQAQNKQGDNPEQAAGIGSGQDLAPPMADNKNLARSLGSYNRVLKRAPAPASAGKTVVAAVRQPQQTQGRRKLTKHEAALAVAIGGGIGATGAKMLLPRVSARIRRMPKSRRLLAALGLGVGGAGLGLLGVHMDKKYGYHPKKGE